MIKIVSGKIFVAEDQGNMQRWKGARPNNREYVVKGLTYYMSLSEDMIVLGMSDGLVKILRQDIGSEVRTMQCEDSGVQQKTIHVNLSISQNILVTGTSNGTDNGQVTVWDITSKARLYRGAPHGSPWVTGVCAHSDLVATGAEDGSLAILTTKPRVSMECLLEGVGEITDLDGDDMRLLVATEEDMKLYSIETRSQPQLVSTATTGYVARCALAFPFAAATGGSRQAGIVIWDIVECVPVRQLHTHLHFFHLHIKES